LFVLTLTNRGPFEIIIFHATYSTGSHIIGPQYVKKKAKKFLD